MISLPLRFIRIRGLQCARELRNTGFFRSAIILLISIATVYLFGFSQLQRDTALAGVLVVAAAVFALHLGRNDHGFIALVTTNARGVYVVEYLAITLVFVVAGVVLGSVYSLLLLPASLLIGLVPGVRKGNVRKRLWTFHIPARLFEWRAGVRRNRVLIMVLFPSALLLSPLPYASIAVIWLLTALVSSFFLDCEGREVVESSGLGPREFLVRKMLLHSGFALIVLCLPLFLHLIFRPGEWIVVAFIILMIVLNVCLFVVSKYASWEPGGKGGANEMIFSFSVISILIPFLLPLPLFFLIRNYYRAQKTLKPVLHDFN